MRIVSLVLLGRKGDSISDSSETLLQRGGGGGMGELVGRQFW